MTRKISAGHGEEAGFQLNPGRAVPRCLGCGLHQPICLCGELAPIATRTRVSVVVHAGEWARSTNSARCLARSLAQARLYVQGGRPPGGGAGEGARLEGGGAEEGTWPPGGGAGEGARSHDAEEGARLEGGGAEEGTWPPDGGAEEGARSHDAGEGAGGGLDLCALRAQPGWRVAVLYPGAGAATLDAAWVARDARPVHLILPDGNWRQAGRIFRRHLAPLRAERVCLAAGDPSRYRLRTHPDPARISTFEAVARALAVLEGPAVAAALMRGFDIFVERSLWSRGQLSEAAVTGGIPDKCW